MSAYKVTITQPGTAPCTFNVIAKNAAEAIANISQRINPIGARIVARPA